MTMRPRTTRRLVGLVLAVMVVAVVIAALVR